MRVGALIQLPGKSSTVSNSRAMLWRMNDLLWLAFLLVLLGAAVVGAGVHAALTGDWHHGGPVTALAYLVTFRRMVVGLALAGAGFALLANIPWLLWASACIGVGELLESSYYIGVLRYAGVTSIRS
ncbi:MAG: hypothetical protein JOZ81_04660 [Chloroflexi bacterium]|nr:hypothetical protein [Chloroflexota bacterium]